MKIPIYSSLNEKSIKFETENINKKEELDILIKHFNSNNDDKKYIFRGVTEAKYKLFNSAQRHWIGEELNKLGKSYQEFIQTIINNSKKYHDGLLTKFYDSFGHVAYDLSILSFLQHYKAPTPLLDFTYNFDSALFFATDGLIHTNSNEIDNYFSIYFIDTSTITNQFPSVITFINSSLSTLNDLLNSPRRGRKHYYFSELRQYESLQYKAFHNKKLFYLPGYSPLGIMLKKIDSKPDFKLIYNQQNLNIINQKGLFVFNSNPLLPLEEIFIKKNSIEINPENFLPKIKCWNIHKSLSEYIIHYLTHSRKIPIDREFMFPQEEIIAQSAYKQFKNFES